MGCSRVALGTGVIQSAGVIFHEIGILFARMDGAWSGDSDTMKSRTEEHKTAIADTLNSERSGVKNGFAIGLTHLVALPYILGALYDRAKS